MGWDFRGSLDLISTGTDLESASMGDVLKSGFTGTVTTRVGLEPESPDAALGIGIDIGPAPTRQA